MKNIVLIGMRGSGKSTLGKKLAQELNREFIDMDQEIERKAGKRTAEIVAEAGWAHFRELEAEVCAEIAQKKNAVIATGGGVILNPENVRQLKRNGMFLLLWVPLEILVVRLQKEMGNRPQLTDKDSLQEEIGAVWAERRNLYFDAADRVWREEENADKRIAVLRDIFFLRNNNNLKDCS